MKRQYNKTLLTISAGQQSVEKRLMVDSGERIYARVVAKPAMDKIIEIGMYENGNEVHPPMDVSHYDGEVGSFEQRGLELNYKGGSEITVRANLPEALAAGEKLEIEVVFLIYVDEKC